MTSSGFFFYDLLAASQTLYAQLLDFDRTTNMKEWTPQLEMAKILT